MQRGDVEALLERVKAAKAPDREIDADIMAANFKWAQRGLPYLGALCIGDEPVYWHAPDPWYKREVPELTGSIDAIVTLIHEDKYEWGRKVICGFFAGGQLFPDQSSPDDSDYDPRARPDNSVTVGWMAHVAYYKPVTGSETYGPEEYCHGRTAALALCQAYLTAKLSLTGTDK